MTTYDRHLLARFLHAFVVFFVAALGLYVVVDGFTNLDGFQAAVDARYRPDKGVKGAPKSAQPVADKSQEGSKSLALLLHMAKHYLYQSSLLLELVGPTVAIASVMAVLALVCKHGELHPLLAAGVPTYRLSAPFLGGMLLVNVGLIANQEFILPRISTHLQGSHGETAKDARPVEPCMSASGIFISGKDLYLENRRLREAEFLFRDGPLANGFVSLRADEAFHYPAQGKWPAGWLLKNAAPRYDKLTLTDGGKQLVIPQRNGTDMFVVTEVTFDELYNRSTSFKFLSTAELLQRVRRPALGTTSVRAQLLHLHSRFLRPAMLIVAIFLILPLIIRREHTNLITNVALGTLLIGVVFGCSQALQFVSQAGLMAEQLATWAPLIGSAGLSAWMTPLVRS